MNLLKMCGRQIRLCLFLHCVETVKQLDYNRYSQLTQWCSGNASALGARLGSIPGSGKGFYV